jgi:hypothetical protein
MTYLPVPLPLSKNFENLLTLNEWPSLNFINVKLLAIDRKKRKKEPVESNITKLLALTPLSMNVFVIDTFICSPLISYRLNTTTKNAVLANTRTKVPPRAVETTEPISPMKSDLMD